MDRKTSIIVNRHRRFTYKLVDFLIFFFRSSVRPSVCPSVHSILHFVFSILDFFFRPSYHSLQYRGIFFCFSCSIIHFVLFFFYYKGLFFWPSYYSLLFYRGLFLSPHPIIHFVLEVFFTSFQFFTSSSIFFFIQDFFLSAILLFTLF